MRSIFLLLLVFVGYYAHAQQQPVFTQSIQNTMLINPAATGVKQFLDAKVGYRRQWMEIPYAPSSFYATMQSPIGSSNYTKSHLSGGTILINDMSGNIRQTTFKVVPAYHFLVSNKKNKSMRVSAGLGLGFTNYGIDGSQVIVQNTNDPIAYAIFTRPQFAFDMGVRLSSQKGSSEVYFVGLAFSNSQKHEVLYSGRFNQILSTITLSSGLAFAVPNLPRCAVVVSSIIRYNKVALQPEATVLFRKESKFWAGTSYRYIDGAVGFQFGGFFSENLNATLSCEIPSGNRIGKLNTKFLGTTTYELSVGLRIPNGRGRKWSKEDMPNVDN